MVNKTIDNFLSNNVIKEATATSIIAMNDKTIEYGLSLTKEEAYELINEKDESVNEHNLFEFDSDIINKIIYEFMDSPYMDKYEYFEILNELIDTYYEYRTNYGYFMNDDIILKAMRYVYDKAGIPGLLNDTEVIIIKDNIKHKRNWDYIEDKIAFLSAGGINQDE